MAELSLKDQDLERGEFIDTEGPPSPSFSAASTAGPDHSAEQAPDPFAEEDIGKLCPV